MKNKRFWAHMALLAVNAIYGLNYVFAKDVMPVYIQPSGFILTRVIGAVVLFWLLHLFLGVEKIEKKDFFRLAISGLFGVAANQLMFFQGLNLSTPINASVLMVATPITVLIIASIVIGEKLTPLKITGILVGAIGAVALIIYSRGAVDFSSQTRIGNIFILLNAFSYAIYLVIAKPLMKKYKPLTVITWVFTFGLIYVLPFGFNELKQVEWSSFSFDIWWRVAYIILLVTFVTYLFNLFALKYVESSVVSIYIYSQPLIAAAHSMILGKDSLTYITVLCASAIFIGVGMVSWRKRLK